VWENIGQNGQRGLEVGFGFSDPFEVGLLEFCRNKEIFPF
jgi:hypothetical protein